MLRSKERRSVVHYVTVFDATTQPLRHWSFFAFGLVGIGFGVLFALLQRRHRVTRWFVLAFFVVWTAGAAISVIGGNLGAGHDLRVGDCKTVEGPVENFHTGYEQKDESFSVQGVSFEYSDYTITGAFNHMASQGGPIRPGLPVRICYRDGDILRLEIAR